LQFPLSEGFEHRSIEEDLISFFARLLIQSFIIPLFNSLFVYARIFLSI
jgi:hypothetical protein